MFKQSAQHVGTYYARTYPGSIPLRPIQAGSEETDVLIIGAGFSGLHTGLRLAEAGKRVTLLEASRVAWAASGRNGGQALLGWSCDMPPLEKALGDSDPDVRKLAKLALTTIQMTGGNGNAAGGAS